MSAPTNKAKYKLHISANSGYRSTTEGWCTPDQYGNSVAVLHGKPTKTEVELLDALRDAAQMLDNLNSAYGSDEVDAVVKRGRAAIAKATGESL